MRRLNQLLAGLLLSAGIIFSSHAADATMPRVTIHTNLGNIVVELNDQKAPKSVANFLSYVNEGFYSNTIFHRVISNFMVQGGGFDASFNRKETHDQIQNEADNGLHNGIGTLAMARTGAPHSATAQFFINVADNGFLDHTSPTARGWGYCVFGKVVEGMDVVNVIRNTSTGSGGPFPKDVPQSAVIIEKIELME